MTTAGTTHRSPHRHCSNPCTNNNNDKSNQISQTTLLQTKTIACHLGDPAAAVPGRARSRLTKRSCKRKSSSGSSNSFVEEIIAIKKTLCGSCDSSQMQLSLLIMALVGTQMIMLISTKEVLTAVPLPLSLCQAQFVVSSCSSGLLLKIWDFMLYGNILGSPKEKKATQTSSRTTSWTFYLPLSACWTMGFVLFNASASYMSPSYVDLIRCGEPVATVVIGFVVFKKRYSWRVPMTLIPVMGGVWLARPSSGGLSVPGILLAALSNVCFCVRPFVLHKMKEKRSFMISTNDDASTIQTFRNTSKEQDDLYTFLQVTTIAAIFILPPLVWFKEGQLLGQYYGSLYSKLDRNFLVQILGSSLGFFSYQYTQLRVMSLISPLAFSILTPVIKASMILLCSAYFGDAFSFQQILGVAITAGGGYWFTQTKSKDGNKRPDVGNPTTTTTPSADSSQQTVLPVHNNPRHAHAS